ncbi:MAG: hypothetical protein ACXVEF_11150 [Polyangiales bacterium]
MFADPKKVSRRRLARRVKATASLAIALVAGGFLACKSVVDNVFEGSSKTPPIKPDDAGSPDTDGKGAGAQPDAALTVDAREHKKGMPVPDNLLE